MNKTVLACLIAWLIPGGGHMFLRKWNRGLIYLPLVLILFVTGLSMDGKLFGLEPGFFGILRFIADGSTGLFYIFGKLLGAGTGDILSMGYEYGNTFLYTAGLINMLLILDTYDIARGNRK